MGSENKQSGKIKATEYRYTLANSSLTRSKELANFVIQYFGGHIPEPKEWQDFFVDLLREYTVSKKIPEVKIIDIEKHDASIKDTDRPNNTLGSFVWGDDDEKGIFLSRKTVERLSNKNYSLINAVSTLMHEFRHFYQYEAQYEAGSKIYSKILGDSLHSVRRGVRMPLISTSDKILTICKMIHSVTSDCDFVERLLELNKEKQNIALYYIAYCSYYYAPHEKDARDFGGKMADLVFSDWFDMVDEQTKSLLEADYYGLNESDEIVETLHRATSCYNAFIKSVKTLPLQVFEEMGQKILKMNDYDINQLYFGFLNVVYGDDTLEEQLGEILECVTSSYPCLFENLFDVFDFDKKQLSLVKKLILASAENGDLTDEILIKLCGCDTLLSYKNIENLLLWAIKNNKLGAYDDLYNEWLFRGTFQKDEDEFADKLLCVLEEKTNEILASIPDKKSIENARHILSLLNHVVDDGYFSAEDEKISAMMENLCGFIGNESEREN